jgi:hypothetical protein
MGTTRKITAGRAHSRWGFLSGIDIGADGDPYLDRLRLIETPWLAIYLHHIHRPDKAPDPHDHPWAFWSVILSGSYTERVWPDKRDPARRFTRLRERFTVHRMARRAAHMITTVEAPLWTLVVTGPRRGEWGFWADGAFMPWQAYAGSDNGVTAGRRGRHRESRLLHPDDRQEEMR